jgi:hypothetical protein
VRPTDSLFTHRRDIESLSEIKRSKDAQHPACQQQRSNHDRRSYGHLTDVQIFFNIADDEISALRMQKFRNWEQGISEYSLIQPAFDTQKTANDSTCLRKRESYTRQIQKIPEPWSNPNCFSQSNYKKKGAGHCPRYS